MKTTSDQLIQDALRFMADLNGCEWIQGDDPGAKDMRQRAQALHHKLSEHVYRPQKEGI